MEEHIPAAIAVLALLAAFLISVAAFRYLIQDRFTRTRFIMSSLFLFIVATLTISFWPYARLTLPFALPALLFGVITGQAVGVRAAEQRVIEHGIEHYMERFSRVSHKDIEKLTWWSIVNFYSVMCGLLLINLIGLTNIILSGSSYFVIATSSLGAFFVGTIVPYLVHLWTIPFTHGRLRKKPPKAR